MMMYNMDVKNISRYRSELMGCAMLWIILFHLPQIPLVENNTIVLWISKGARIFQWIGFYGVDIFLFLSGYGLVYSLEQNNLWEYYKKRMLRIFPGLIIISLLYCLIVLKPSTIIDFCGKMLVTAST